MPHSDLAASLLAQLRTELMRIGEAHGPISHLIMLPPAGTQIPPSTHPPKRLMPGQCIEKNDYAAWRREQLSRIPPAALPANGKPASVFSDPAADPQVHAAWAKAGAMEDFIRFARSSDLLEIAKTLRLPYEKLHPLNWLLMGVHEVAWEAGGAQPMTAIGGNAHPAGPEQIGRIWVWSGIADLVPATLTWCERWIENQLPTQSTAEMLRRSREAAVPIGPRGPMSAGWILPVQGGTPRSPDRSSDTPSILTRALLQFRDEIVDRVDWRWQIAESAAADKNQLLLLQEAVDRLRPRYVYDATSMLLRDGFAAFELAARELEPGGLVVMDQINPLEPARTRPRVSRRGDFEGIDQGRRRLSSRRTIWLSWGDWPTGRSLARRSALVAASDDIALVRGELVPVVDQLQAGLTQLVDRLLAANFGGKARGWLALQWAWKPLQGKLSGSSDETDEGRSPPMSKTELAKRILNRSYARPRNVGSDEIWTEKYDLRREGDSRSRTWTISLAGLDAATRKRILTP